MESSILFQRLGISLLLGLLVGLQRQHATFGMPGLRTFPLISVFGTVMALLAQTFGGWVLATGLIGIVGVLVFPNLVRIRSEDPDPGITTDIAALLMYGVGALLVVGPVEVAVVVGGGVAVLLQFKPEMHGFVERLGDRDLRGIMQFVLITCVILPILPNRNFGPQPLDVFNPFNTWLMVVLIVGMSLTGYILYKFIGRDAGILLGGVLGGIISSTATTASYARQARQGPTDCRIAAIVIMVASTIVFLRVLVEIAVVDLSFLSLSVVPIAVLMTLVMLPALIVWYRVREQPILMPNQENPTQLKSAVFFALMYALVLFALAAAKQYTNGQALYPVALLSGLTDMDAITLSTARMVGDDLVSGSDGWRLIVAAAFANLIFKACIAGVLGGRRLFAQIALLFTLPMIGSIMLIFFWPW